MQFLSCTIRSSANDNGRSLLTIFTAKRIILQIIWSILVIPFMFDFHIIDLPDRGVPTSFIMTLLVCHSLGVLVF
ncbi:hypothetical protein LINGRAHAP2_LOCUS20115 [Linum grandiflorum]